MRADLYLNLLTPVYGEKDEPIYFDLDFMITSKSMAGRIVPGVNSDLDNVDLLQKLKRLGQYSGVFLSATDP